jgi:hypothetical protein
VKISIDGNGSKYIGWRQLGGALKRAWVQHRSDADKDWAGTKRYLLVVRCDEAGRPAGNATDFPIYNDLPDEQILLAFVHGLNAITGCRTEDADA